MSVPQHDEMTSTMRDSQHVVIDVERYEALFVALLDRLERLEQRHMTPEMIAEAMSVGAGRAVSNPENWCLAASGLRAATERQAGPWVIRGGAWKVIKWWGAGMALIFVLAAGGPTAAWAFIKSWFAP